MTLVCAHELKSKFNICLGITPWKRENFLNFVGGRQNAKFMSLRNYTEAVQLAADLDGRVICWASSVSEGLQAAADHLYVDLIRVEDGFIRSSGLGIKLNMPASLCFSDRGIHYDARTVSTLEAFLETHEFTDAERARGHGLIRLMRERKITKYNLKSTKAEMPEWPTDDLACSRILVIGQVGDDASLRYGAPGIDSNEDLLRRVRDLNPYGAIIYRPHPDVTCGLRKGTVPTDVLNELGITQSTKGDLFALMQEADEVHVASSQTGLEALIHGAHVVCHGLPFYAGWGLTTDTSKTRGYRALSLEELVYGAFCAYPVYVDPFTGEEITAEETINLILSGRAWPRAPRSYMIAVWWNRRLRKFRKAVT
ncbi:beta-3-deoxy-D-manno-oct-2-ulosonic acid transferase [Salipiger mucosus]|uniref:Capsular polysaccharide biosynthesis/export periplasmic protein WcbA n=1 Tax=Salipiger mucosus DSM 16094 TaxID=1123237 RepID=S9Q9C9_9RHOB|nr:beta-3-deoxy-D-manno-oct-2-ulosonic acid transferase [Salipiger mucosus]EPX77981.1 Capsular polysaccharide biosynthesis/export periplasmic protein WcbA [Salipiger mucosus DSM 16094]